MKDINQIIDEWIGEEKAGEFIEGDYDYGKIEGYNDKIQDLKSRKQELIEGIVGLISGVKQNFANNEKAEYMKIGFFMAKDEIIKELTNNK